MKHKLLVVCFLLIALLTGCRAKTDKELFYEAQKHITNLSSYTCDAQITIYGNKNPETYIVKQWYKAPDKYRIEIEKPEALEGKITIYNGNRVFIKHPKIGQGWIMKSYKKTLEEKMFLGDFVHKFVSNESGEINRETINGRDYILLTTEIPGEHPYFNKEKLWFDVEKYYPYRLQVLDFNGKIRIDVKYFNFKYNQKIKEDIFKIQTDD